MHFFMGSCQALVFWFSSFLQLLFIFILIFSPFLLPFNVNLPRFCLEPAAHLCLPHPNSDSRCYIDPDNFCICFSGPALQEELSIARLHKDIPKAPNKTHPQWRASYHYSCKSAAPPDLLRTWEPPNSSVLLCLYSKQYGFGWDSLLLNILWSLLFFSVLCLLLTWPRPTPFSLHHYSHPWMCSSSYLFLSPSSSASTLQMN